MNSHRIIFPLLLGLLLIALASLLSACSQVLSAVPVVDAQSQVNTAVASTLVSYIVETRVAERVQATAVSMEQAQQATATVVPSPTATPVPTATPTVPPPPPAVTAPPAPPPAAPAPTSAAAAPKIWADFNTNCRTGPSVYYRVVGYLLIGATSYVYGRDAGKDWWYIQNPTRPGEYCWVWDGSTNVEGDTSTLPVIAVDEPDQGPTYGNWWDNGNWYGGTGNGGMWYGGNWCEPFYYKGELIYNCYPSWYAAGWYQNNNWNCNQWVSCQCQLQWTNCKKPACWTTTCCKQPNPWKNCKKKPTGCWK